MNKDFLKIINKLYKEVDIVMLPTDYGRLTKHKNGTLSLAKGNHFGVKEDGLMIPQHLYFLSNDVLWMVKIYNIFKYEENK